MKTAFLAAYFASIVLAAISLFVLPQQVAVQFGPGGWPGDWASKEAQAIVSILLETLLFFALWFSPWLTLQFPSCMLSLPNKQYWLAMERRASLKRKLEGLMSKFGATLFAYLFAVNALVLHANLRQPVRLDEKTFLILTAAFLAYTLLWTIGLYRAFRIPSDASGK